MECHLRYICRACRRRCTSHADGVLPADVFYFAAISPLPQLLALHDDALALETAKSPTVYVLQLMLGETAPHYNRIAAVPLTGEYDADTQSAVRHAQKIFQLPETSITDRATWQALTGLHNALFQRTPLGWQINGELRLENEK